MTEVPSTFATRNFIVPRGTLILVFMTFARRAARSTFVDRLGSSDRPWCALTHIADLLAACFRADFSRHRMPHARLNRPLQGRSSSRRQVE